MRSVSWKEGSRVENCLWKPRTAHWKFCKNEDSISGAKTGYGPSLWAFLTAPFCQAKTIAISLLPLMNFKRKNWLTRRWRTARRFWYPKPIPRGAWSLWDLSSAAVGKNFFGLHWNRKETWKLDPSQLILIHVQAWKLLQQRLSDRIWWRILRPLSRTFCWVYHG